MFHFICRRTIIIRCHRIHMTYIAVWTYWMCTRAVLFCNIKFISDVQYKMKLNGAQCFFLVVSKLHACKCTNGTLSNFLFLFLEVHSSFVSSFIDRHIYRLQWFAMKFWSWKWNEVANHTWKPQFDDNSPFVTHLI